MCYWGGAYIVFFALFPLAVNGIFVACDEKSVNTLCMYPLILAFVLFLSMLEHLQMTSGLRKTIYAGGIILLAILSILYCKLDNICYMKMQITEAEAISYFNRLADDIQSAEGYRASYPVLYLNGSKKTVSNIKSLEQFEEIRFIPYWNIDKLINDYVWQEFMAVWCGFAPDVIDDTFKYQDLKEVSAMPHYPEDGSIKIIDKKVIVNF